MKSAPPPGTVIYCRKRFWKVARRQWHEGVATVFSSRMRNDPDQLSCPVSEIKMGERLLYEWFLKNIDFPMSPFELRPGVIVADLGKWLAYLRPEVEESIWFAECPYDGLPRQRTGALQADLIALWNLAEKKESGVPTQPIKIGVSSSASYQGHLHGETFLEAKARFYEELAAKFQAVLCDKSATESRKRMATTELQRIQGFLKQVRESVNAKSNC
ncbi:MAG: hypothetical protein ACKO24_01315 [Leptolyngbyaceae cyanobacterium]